MVFKLKTLANKAGMIVGESPMSVLSVSLKYLGSQSSGNLESNEKLIQHVIRNQMCS